MQELLSARSQFRRARRWRKTRYRKVRFLNRKKPDGWLAPSVRHKVEAHLKTVRLVHKILPVHTITIEVAQFNIQKIRSPEIEGKESRKDLSQASGMSVSMCCFVISIAVVVRWEDQRPHLECSPY